MKQTLLSFSFSLALFGLGAYAQNPKDEVEEAAQVEPSIPPELVPSQPEEEENESPASGDASGFAVSEKMALFKSHVGSWKGMTKTASTEKGEKTITNTRSEWMGGFLLGGHVFEIRGYSYGELGRTQYRWQYTFDSLKERFMASYYDSHAHTHFFEGKVNVEGTKIIWRLLAPPGDMTWHVETDLQAENGIETNGRITSEEFKYDMVYTSVFKQS